VDATTLCNTEGRIDPWTPIYFNPTVSIGWISADPDDLMPAQPEPLIYTFTRPILNPVVVGSGDVPCVGSPGEVIAHTISEQTVTVPLQIIDPSDCGLDEKTTGYISPPIITSDPIRAIEIMPPSAMQWHFEYTITACDDDGSNCQPVTIQGDPFAHVGYSIYFRETPIDEPTLTVSCTPAAVVRRADVRCLGHVTPARPYTLLRKQADAEGHTYVDDRSEEKAAGDDVDWSGTAIVDTRVSMTVRITTTTGTRELSGEATFTVSPETWPPFVMPQRPTPIIATTELPYPPIQEKNGQDQIPDGSLGVMDLYYDGSTPVSVFSGPNTNWFYIPRSVSLASADIFINRALDANDPFYKAQTGTSPNQVLGIKYCSAGDMQNLRRQVIDHENAHYDAYITYFAANDVPALFERLHMYMDVASLGQPGVPTLKDTWGPYELAQAHAGVDAYQKATVDSKPALIRCKFRYPGGPR